MDETNTKPLIEIDEGDRQWIKFCKLHFMDKYPLTGEWVLTIKPFFTERYGWNPDEGNNFESYLSVLFNRLLDVYLKIAEDKSGSNNMLKEIFSQVFYKRFHNDSDRPIIRGINSLCGLIQANTVIDGEILRYNL